MKKFIIALIFLIISILNTNLSAKESNETKTLFGNQNPISTKDIVFFIAPYYGLTHFDGSATSLFTIRGGLNFKDVYSLGAFFNTSITDIKPDSETVANIYMDYWSVGGFIEYTLLPDRIFHVTLPLYIGYGEVEMDNDSGDIDLGEANFFKVHPSALLEVNILRNVRFNFGVGYRFVGKMSYRNFNQTDISGLTGHIGLKFGNFK
jgi:hypothetical protein